MGGGGTLADGIRRYFHHRTSINSFSLNLLKVHAAHSHFIPSSMDRHKKIFGALEVVQTLRIWIAAASSLPFWPVQILQSTGVGRLEVSYEVLESILPAAAYALAKLRMHLVYSGYFYTARGGFCYLEEDIFDVHADGNEDGLPTEGVEITHFNVEGAHYMIYTPSDPLLVVAKKDQNGMLQIADNELLEDPSINSAIDEETEFNALVFVLSYTQEEEAALLDSVG